MFSLFSCGTSSTGNVLTRTVNVSESESASRSVYIDLCSRRHKKEITK